jgi:uncharacterized protein (TIRG00374 family)
VNTRRKRTARLLIELAVFALIAALFIRALDLRRVREIAAFVTPRVLLGVLGFQTGILALGSLCWALILKEAGIYRGAWRTFWARVSGFAVTYVTPSVTLGGIPARAKVYQDDSMETPRLYATIAADTFVEVAGKIPCMTAGFFLLLLGAHPPLALAIASAAVLLLFTAFFVVAMARLLGGKTSITRSAKKLLRLLAAVRPRRAAAILSSLRAFDRSLRNVLRRKRVFLLALGVAALIGFLEVMQTFFILAALGRPGISPSFIIYSSILFQGITGLLPGNLGGMEGTHFFLYSLLGLGVERSLIYTAVLRLGQMSMVAMGMANILAWRLRRGKARRGAAGAARAVPRRQIRGLPRRQIRGLPRRIAGGPAIAERSIV